MQLVDREVPGPKRDYIGYGRRIPRVVWPNRARVAVNVVVTYEEGSEYSIPAGDGRNERLGELAYAMEPHYRDLSQESVYEYGSRAGIWRVLRTLERHAFPATFFACAVALERNPEVAAAIRERRDDICSHGWRWEEPWLLSRDEEREHMLAAIDSFKQTVGERPRGWYCRYAPSVNTRELVVEEGGFLYDSDAYNDDLPYFVNVKGKQHLVVPYTHSYNDSRFIAAQGFSSYRDYFDQMRSALDVLWEEGTTHPKMLSIGLHPRWIGQAGRITALNDFIAYALDKGDVWFARRNEIARWWLDHQEEFARD